MTAVSRFERKCPVRRRKAGVELSRLGHGAAGQLRTRDPSREPEVVLDSPRRAGLAAEPGAVDDQRVEPLGSAVDGGAKARRAGADHKQINLLVSFELATDTERSGELAGRRPAQLHAAGQTDKWQLRGAEAGDKLRRGLIGIGALGIAPDERNFDAADEVEYPHRGRRRVRADDLDAEALDPLKQLATSDQGGQTRDR